MGGWFLMGNEKEEYHKEELSEEGNADDSENHGHGGGVEVGFGLGNFHKELVLLRALPRLPRPL